MASIEMTLTANVNGTVDTLCQVAVPFPGTLGELAALGMKFLGEPELTLTDAVTEDSDTASFRLKFGPAAIPFAAKFELPGFVHDFLNLIRDSGGSYSISADAKLVP